MASLHCSTNSFVCFYTSEMLFFAFVCSLGCSVYDTVEVMFQFCPYARGCELTAEDIVDPQKIQQLLGLGFQSR